MTWLRESLSTRVSALSPSIRCPHGGPRQARGIETVDLSEHVNDLGDVVRELTDGRGTDSGIDAVGMEAHGSKTAPAMPQAISSSPDAVASPMAKLAGVDQLAAVTSAIDIVRRGGTISLIGVYGGAADPLPLNIMFDKQMRLRMGQANVTKRAPEILKTILSDDDPLGVESFATPRLPLADAARLRDFPEEAGRCCQSRAIPVAHRRGHRYGGSGSKMSLVWRWALRGAHARLVQPSPAKASRISGPGGVPARCRETPPRVS